MEYDFSTIGALLGLAVSIVLIIRKVQTTYSLILGALIALPVGGSMAKIGPLFSCNPPSPAQP